MANKKIVLFIVEGINDKTNLALCMGQLMTSDSVHFEITQGDITTKYGNSPGNIAARVGNIVKEFSGRIFRPRDFLRVVHLIDMDGAYVSKDKIVKGAEDKNDYLSDKIVTSRVSKTIERNNQKQEILERIIDLGKVWGCIPYSAYYFSCNLDHVLHNNPNLTQIEKYELAMEFENKYIGKPEELVKFFNTDTFAVTGTYDESWNFIKIGTNSLKRYSNFSVFLNEVNE